MATRITKRVSRKGQTATKALTETLAAPERITEARAQQQKSRNLPVLGIDHSEGDTQPCLGPRAPDIDPLVKRTPAEKEQIRS